MGTRNRAEGWKYAKLSGHKNEELVEALTINDRDIQARILECAKRPDAIVESVYFGGLREKNINCIFGGKTKSKTDMSVFLLGGDRINISIKKSKGGQVFLIGVDRFINGFEAQYKLSIPEDVKRAISLFWGTAEDTESIIQMFSSIYKRYELRKHRLTNKTLSDYDTHLPSVLIDWFNQNISDVFDFCFSRGLAQSSDEFADIIWYRNEVDETAIDDLFHIDDLKQKIKATAVMGEKNGGTTIQLPFGFVQWHSPGRIIPGCMQFHHNYEKIKAMFSD